MKNYVIIMSLAGLGILAGAANAADSKSLKKGKAVYDANCLSCHGEKGDGDSPAGKALNPSPRNFAKDEFKKGDSPEQVLDTITNGMGSSSLMVSFAHLSEEDRKAVRDYVLSFRKGHKKNTKK